MSNTFMSYVTGETVYYLQSKTMSKDEVKELENRILTNDKIVLHVLNCETCINNGLSDCSQLAKLKGVWT